MTVYLNNDLDKTVDSDVLKKNINTSQFARLGEELKPGLKRPELKKEQKTLQQKKILRLKKQPLLLKKPQLRLRKPGIMLKKLNILLKKQRSYY